MRRRLAPFLVLLFVLTLPGLALATLIHNEDNRDYVIKLEQGGGSVSSTVKANRAISFRCAKLPCTVSLGESSITIRSSREDVVIRDGKLVRKAKLVATDE